MENNTINLSDLKEVEHFTPTMNFRYMKRHMIIGDDIEYIPMLQQMWRGSAGTEEWRWVEVVE